MKKTRKLLGLLLAILMVITMLPLSVVAENTSTVSASANDPNAISTADEFISKLGTPGSHYLTNDIDFSGKKIEKQYVVKQFCGEFDGNGYALKNITMNITAANISSNVGIGIFGNVGDPGNPTVLSNFTVENIKINFIDKDINGENYFAAGFLVGTNNDFNKKLAIHDVHVINGVMDADLCNRSNVFVGGFIGIARSMVTITNSSIDGKIDLNCKASIPTYVGGFVGYRYQAFLHGKIYSMMKSVISNSVNSADMTITYADGIVAAEDSAVGGIIGKNRSLLTIADCTFDGEITTTARSGGVIGHVDHYDLNYDPNNTANDEKAVTTHLVVVAGTVVPDGYNIYGGVIEGARFCVAGCKSGEKDSDQNSEMTAIKTADDFLQINRQEGFFYLANDIDFSKCSSFENCVNAFSGVLYGNGKTLKNIRLSGAGDLGVFYAVAGTNDTAIIDLNIGSKDSPMVVSSTNGRAIIGLLSSRTGTDYYGGGKSGCTVTVCGVNIYTDCTAYGYQTGGFVGLAEDFACFNSNIYGSMNLKRNSQIAYVAGFVGFALYPAEHDTGNRTFYDMAMVACNNFLDIAMDVTPDKTQSVSGFVGYTRSRSMLILGCNNFGNMISSSRKSGCASAFMFATCDNGKNVIVDSENFGTLSAGVSAVVLVAPENHNPESIRILSVRDYGEVHGAKNNEEQRFLSKDLEDLNKDKVVATVVGCEVVSAATMRKGASVRINSESTGIRFTSDISYSFVTRLRAMFGYDAVTYGTIISPEPFVREAGGALTKEALDNLAKVRDELFEEGAKAYVDIPAEEWFGGEKGVIAGSVLNLGDLIGENFIGRSYVNVTVDGEVLFTKYADYADGDIDNNTRNVKYLAECAINDVVYTKNGRYYNIVDGEYALIRNNEGIAEEYNVELGVENGYTKLSCYTLEQYNKLIAIAE